MDIPGGPAGRIYGPGSNEPSVMIAAKANLNILRAFQKSGMIGGDPSDPLIERGNHVLHNARTDAKENALRVVRTTMMAIVPVCFFTASLCFTVWAMDSSNPIEYIVLYVVAVTGFIVYGIAVARSIGDKQTKSRWRRWTGRLTQLATVLGVIVGEYIFYKHFVFYRVYMGMNTYTNIAASQPVDQFVDAGMIAFTSHTSLDLTRAVGFKSATADAMLCVAPVIDSTMGFDQEVHFFAVGVGCCEPRASFSCDDASDGSTKNALLMLEPRMLVSPLMEWTVAGALDRSGFDAAIRMQAAAYQTVVASKTRLLFWTKDPEAKAKWHLYRGEENVIIATAIYFVASILVAWCHMYAPKGFFL